MRTYESLRVEAERQLSAAAVRHREAVALMAELGRPESDDHMANKSLGRAVHLVTFAVKSVGRAVHLVSAALTRAAEAGVPFERLVELTGWDAELVQEGLDLPPTEPALVAKLAPEGVDAEAVAQAAAIFDATTRLQILTRRVLADVDDVAWSPASADLDDLYDRLDFAWQAWRQEAGRGWTD